MNAEEGTARPRPVPAHRRLAATARDVAARLGPAARRLAPVAAAVTPLGRSVLAGSVGLWLLGWWFGWVELSLAATAGLVLLGLCALLTAGRTRLRVQVVLAPSRVVVGDTATGHVTVANLAGRRLLPIAFEVPIGAGAARFSLPGLAGRQAYEEPFLVATVQRGVIPVGPATTVREDPLGLLRRTMAWTEVHELFVHPVTVPLEPLGAGILRDLEGRTTSDVSMTDLAFHTLREYAPGDDRRYIHWRSSAKVGSSVPGGRFLVRQFLDTRRSHVTVVIDADPDAYPDPEGFETAISAGGSIIIRTVRDEQQASLVVGGQAVPAGSDRQHLDALARAELGAWTLPALARRAGQIAPDTSLGVLISGAGTPFASLHRAAVHLPPQARRLAVRIEPGRPAGVRTAGSLTVLSLPRLADLPAVLAAAVAP
jgi:uncharacterized protein (DUF58 family)